MIVINDISNLHMERPTAVCIGKFDGVHVGHKKLLEYITAQKQRGMLATVFTFNPSPEELFSGIRNESLCSRIEKEAYLEEAGVDVIIEFPLTFESAAIEPEDFVKDILIDKLNMKYIAAGADLSFGNKGRGNRAMIERMAEQFCFECDIIEKVQVDGEDVSSSRIREAIRAGSVDEARRMLGRMR